MNIEEARKTIQLKIWFFCLAETILVVASFILLWRLGTSPSAAEAINFSAAAFIPMALLLNWMFQTLYAGIPKEKQSPHRRFVRGFQFGSWALTILLLIAVVFVSLWNA